MPTGWNVTAGHWALALANLCACTSRAPTSPPQSAVVAPSASAVQLAPDGRAVPPVSVAVAASYDRAHWVSGAESPAREFSAVSPRCLKDVGCPYPPLELPECPADASFIAYEPNVDLPSLIGKLATFKGMLREHSLSTLLDCHGCCNSAGGELWLAHSATASNEVPRVGVALTNGKQPLAFTCRGDESRTCCGFRADQDVLVSGILRQKQGRYALDEALLCKWVRGVAQRE